jgi:hypothetical protein
MLSWLHAASYCSTKMQWNGSNKVFRQPSSFLLFTNRDSVRWLLTKKHQNPSLIGENGEKSPGLTSLWLCVFREHVICYALEVRHVASYYESKVMVSFFIKLSRCFGSFKTPKIIFMICLFRNILIFAMSIFILHGINLYSFSSHVDLDCRLLCRQVELWFLQQLVQSQSEGLKARSLLFFDRFDCASAPDIGGSSNFSKEEGILHYSLVSSLCGKHRTMPYLFFVWTWCSASISKLLG